MCGILLSISCVRGLPYKKALDSIRHRGPDAGDIKKFHQNGLDIVLGHRRLAIIDLDVRSNQPMSYQNRYWITYNGEIYNYLELRKNLIKFGHQFRTHSDTEILLAAYAEWGKSMLGKLNGMFAFCIYDSIENTVFVARDRYGIKPLYYFSDPNKGIFFVSEIKQVLALGLSKKTINNAVMIPYVLSGDFSQIHQTMLSDIQEFPEATYSLFHVSDFSREACGLNFYRWYQLPSMAFDGSNQPEKYAELMQDAVAMRLRSDVKAGGLLSGGIDSSVIALMMHEQQHKNATYLTARFENSQHDESGYAETVANHLGVNLIKLPIHPGNLADQLSKITYFFDAPVPGRSSFPHYCLYQAVAEQGIKVCLEGQGADETLFGYTAYQYAYLVQLLKKAHVMAYMREARAFAANEQVSLQYVSKEVIARFFPNYFNRRSVSKMNELLNADYDLESPLHRRQSSFQGVLDVRMKVLKAILYSVDRMSMSASVEARVPFLDHRVVELFLNAPFSFKIKRGYRKMILRRLLQGKLPDSITYRRDKKGFGAPEAKWIRGEVRESVREAIVSAKEFSIFNIDPILKQFDQFMQGSAPYDPIFWRLYSVSVWKAVFGVGYDAHFSD